MHPESLEKKKGTVLLTGVAGFIGSHLAKRLLDEGYAVVGVDNFNTYYSPRQKAQNLEPLLAHPAFRFEYVDLKEREKLARIFSSYGITHVAHLAARAGVRPSIEKPLWYDESNVTGTLHLLELAAQHDIKHFVFASSSSVYGEQKSHTWKEEDVTDEPISPYAATKKASELFAYTYHHLFGFPVTGLRFFTPYGPGNRPDMAMYKFPEAILAGRELDKYGDGSSVRTYLYIDDLVDGTMRALEHPDGYRIFNLGGDERITLNHLINTLEQATGKKARVRMLPAQVGDVSRVEADFDKATQKLGWRPHTPFTEGVSRLITWLIHKTDSVPDIPGVTKRVLIFSKTYDPYIAAAETAVRQITDRLDHHRYTLITGRFDKKLPRTERIGTVDVVRVGFGNRFDRYWYPFASLRFALSLRERFDLVWTIGASSAGIAAALFTRIRNTPFLLSLQDTRERRLRGRYTSFLFPFFAFVYRSADRVVAVSKDVALQAKQFGVRGVQVIPNGILIGECKKSYGKEYLAARRAELGFKKNDVVLLTGFRLSYENGIDTLIRALPTLPAEVKLLIAGEGGEHDALMRLAGEMGVSDRVLFTECPSYAESVILLKLSDMFVRPARAEGISMDFLEAMLCNVPVIGTNEGGLAEILRADETALVVSPDDPATVAGAVNRLRMDTALRSRVMRNGYHLALREYDWEMVAELMREAFDAVSTRSP
jgi:UDP-glucuronate 4-epimerase